FLPHVLGTDVARGMPAAGCRRRAHRERRLGCRLDAPLAAARQVNRVRLAFERGHALAQQAEIVDPGFSGDQNQADLALRGVSLGALAGSELVHLEADVAPARALRRDAQHLAALAARLYMKPRHGGSPSLPSATPRPAARISPPSRRALPRPTSCPKATCPPRRRRSSGPRRIPSPAGKGQRFGKQHQAPLPAPRGRARRCRDSTGRAFLWFLRSRATRAGSSAARASTSRA